MGAEFTGLDFNSKRLERRFTQTMETLSRKPDKPIWFCGGNQAESKAIYRMPGSENLDREEILRTRREQTARRIVEAAETMLLVQDAASLNYNTHKKTEGIGYISGKTWG
jgi:hypothetical protein